MCKCCQTTFFLLKPGMSKHREAIMDSLMLNYGFRLVAEDARHLTRAQVTVFYEEHQHKPFFSDMAEYMTRGSVHVFALRHELAISKLRAALGSTNSADAAPNTIRALYGSRETVYRNAAHASDSVEAAERELALFFPRFDII